MEQAAPGPAEERAERQVPPEPPLDPAALLGLVQGLVRASGREPAWSLARRLEAAGAWWSLLAEVRDLLRAAPDPRQALPDLCQRLSDATGGDVAVVLAAGEAPETVPDTVVAWPPEGPLARQLATVAGRPPAEGSALAAVRHGHTVHLPVLGGEVTLVGAPGEPRPSGSAAALPLVSAAECLGALLLQAPQPGAVDAALVTLLHEVADRVALCLANSRLRRDLAQLEDAHEAARLREELLAALSHDMQTPLAVLLGSIKALQAVDDLAPKHRAGLYEGMARRGAQLRRLVEQFLDYSRLEAGHPIAVRPAMTDVAAAIAAVETDVGWRRPLEVDVDPDLPQAFVDPDRLDQVLSNLVSNAVKFSPAGAMVSILARATADTVEVEVADRGRGMSPGELEGVFEKFRRGAGTEDIAGTGLGLYVSRAVIEAQGGRITVESRQGEGSRFKVVLPRRPPPG